jgi:hypothetical protein
MKDVKLSPSKRTGKQDIWKELSDGWRQSGLSAKQFCQQHQLKEADLRRWDYRLKKAKHSQNLNSPLNQDVVNQFIPITVSSSTAVSENHSPIDIVLGKNYSIRLTKHYDEEMLVSLIQLLKRTALC